MIYLILASLFSNSALAARPPLFRQFTMPKDPALSCQLDKFTVLNSYFMDGPDAFSSMAAVINTTGPECLRNYAVVQWIRGCIYTETLNPNTRRLTDKEYLDADYSLREVDMPFHVPEWAVDSFSADPMYASKDRRTNNGERMGFYYVAKKQLFVKDDSQSYSADELQIQKFPKYDDESHFFLENAGNLYPTQMYVTDMPSAADVDHASGFETVTTPSLEFKTCVYETKDVPLTGNPATTNTPHSLGGPIVCYDWSHKYHFNTSTEKFEHTPSAPIDSFCTLPSQSK